MVDSIPAMLDFVENTPRPDPIAGFDIERYARSLFTAYYSGLEFYRYFLTSAAPSVLSGLGIVLKGTIDGQANIKPVAASPTTKSSVLPPLLRNARMDLLSLEAHVLKGDIAFAGPAGWVKGKAVTLHLSFGVQSPLYRRANISLRLPTGLTTQTLVVSCNDHLGGIFQLEAGSSTVSVDLPQSLDGVTLSIRLQATDVASEAGIDGLVSLGIERVEFE